MQRDKLNNYDDDPINWLLPLSAIIGAVAYGLFEINPFYFIFATPFLALFFNECSSKN